MAIPKDPVILLSYINTQLRDFYDSFDELCISLSLDQTSIIDTLKTIQYEYDKEQNQFI